MTKALTCPSTWEPCAKSCEDTGRCALRVERGETCDCAHPSDPHVVIALFFDTVHEAEDVPVGGIVLCPVCDCASTWSVQGYPAPEMPPLWELDLLRERALRE